MVRVLFIDNFDSFTYNSVDEFAKRGCDVRVYRNSIPMRKFREIIGSFAPQLICISPGPSAPKDAGNCIKIIKEFAGKIPIFGICLGHQCVVEAFGGKVARANETVHGKASAISHDGKTIFSGIENPFLAGRYHSLCAVKIPETLEVSARSDSGIAMGIRHRKYFVEGVQFHPESILTPVGGRIIENLIRLLGNKGEGE